MTSNQSKTCMSLNKDIERELGIYDAKQKTNKPKIHLKSHSEDSARNLFVYRKGFLNVF